MPHHRIILVIIRVMFSLFSASMEATVVAFIMPAIIGQLEDLTYNS